MEKRDKKAEADRRIALDARDWIVRLTSGDVGEAELQRFKAWRDLSPEHGRAFERERLFWQQLQALDDQVDERPLRQAARTRRHAMGRRAFLTGSGAALSMAAAAVAVPHLQRWWAADFATSVGERAEVALSDGSMAMLNTDSAIAVDFTPKLRLVELLKGEAEFRVRPDASAPFRVAALGGHSDALGTIYSLRAVDGVATVTVTEGVVRVSGGGDLTGAGDVELLAEQQTSYAEGGLPVAARNVDSAAVLAWRNGRVVFEGRPFASAVAELGRYLPERIVMRPGIDGSVPVSAIFSTDEALAGIQALASTQGFAVRRLPGVMIVIS